MLSLGDLATMVVVVNEGSLQSAADKLHKTPPAISLAIKRLETVLGVPIFDRSGYRVSLTEQGQTIYTAAERLLQQAQQLEQMASLMASGVENNYRICVHSMVADSFYLPALTQVADEYPQTNIYLIHEPFNAPFEKLQREEADFAIVCCSHDPTRNNLYEAILLGQVTLVNVIHRSLYASFSGDEPLLQWLKGIRQVIVNNSERDAWGSYSLVAGGKCWYVNNPGMKQALICQAKGWGQLPYHLVESGLASGELVALEEASLVINRNQLDVWALRKLGRPTGLFGTRLWQAFTENACATL